MVLSIIVLKTDKRLWMPIELETINARNLFTLNKTTEKVNDSVVIILFDDKTKFLLRDKGLPINNFEEKGREIISDLIDKLEINGVKAIGINLNLSTPSNPDSDHKLVETLRKYKNIVIAGSIYTYSMYKSNKILESATGVGFGELFPEYNNVVYKIKLIDDEQFESIPSFAHELFKTVNLKEFDKSQNELYIRYPENNITSYSLIDVISNKVDYSQFKGKTVIVGNGLKSKLIKDDLLNQRKVNISDSEVQAIILSNLLNKTFLNVFSLQKNVYLLLLFSLILGVIFSSLPVRIGLIIGSVIFLFVLGLCQIFYSFFNTVIECVPVLFVITFSVFIGSIVYLQINLLKQNMELEFSQGKLSEKNKELSSAFSELNLKINELKEMRKLLADRSEDERKRIARELHDDTLARITDIKREIETIVKSNNLGPGTFSQLNECTLTIDSVTQEIRRIINALRPSMLDNALGLIPAIENLLDGLRKRSNNKIKTKLNTSISKLKLSQSVDIQIYRIIQEALNNIYKHSEATEVEIKILEQFGQLLFIISDNGKGFKEDSSKKGFGFIDMKERAELIGVNIQFINKPQGTAVELVLPINSSDEIISEKKETINTTYN